MTGASLSMKSQPYAVTGAAAARARSQSNSRSIASATPPLSLSATTSCAANLTEGTCKI